MIAQSEAIPAGERRPFRGSSTAVALARGLAFLILTAWILAITLHASVVINGTRVFYLDDVQMVAMRYGRNLAEGFGVTWNPGERVEGYSNPAWVLVMAAVHAAGAPDRTAALFVKGIAWMLACGVLALAVRLRRQLGGPDAWADAAVMLVLAMSADLVFWAANGFETTLLSAVLLWLLARINDECAHGSASATTMAAAGALTLVRSDAHLLVLAVVGVAISLSRDRPRTARLALLACVLPALHEATRLAYYGQWAPNTFFLRMTATADAWREGVQYARRFGRGHVVLIGLALAACARRADGRPRALAAVCAVIAVYACAVGGDFLVPFRFLAPAVPLLTVLAVLAAEDVRQYGVPFGAAALAGVVMVGVASGGMLNRDPVDAMRSWRGKPWQGAAVGVLIATNSDPSATVAARGCGALGYFSRRVTIDLAGRTDPAIARLPARRGADAAERKFDVEASLARRPDFVLTGGPHDPARLGELMFALHGVDPARDLGPAILASPTFQRLYRDYPVRLPLLLDRSAVYVRVDSTQRARVASWRLDVSEF